MPKRILTLFLANFILLYPALLYSQEALSIASLINEAKNNNPDILAAKRLFFSPRLLTPEALIF